MGRSRILGLTIFHCIMSIPYLLISITFWFPSAALCVFKRRKFQEAAEYIILLPFIMVLAGIVEFAVNFGINVDDVTIYNSIDYFYDPAPCGQTRQLKSGILLVAVAGKMYKMMWIAWCLIYIFATASLFSRIFLLHSSYDKYVEAKAARAAERAT